jgi:hypothetical protein
MLILPAWLLVWEAGDRLAGHLAIFNINYTWPVVDALTILLSLLFTLGMQTETSWNILKTAFFGVLGFAFGNFVADTIPLLKISLPEVIGTPAALMFWGLIGGTILELPSRQARRIFLSAGICGLGLLLGYMLGLIIVPAIVGPSLLTTANPTIREEIAILRNISWGVGLGSVLGIMSRRASAIGLLAIIGAGIFATTRALNVDVFDISSFWENIVRGALIGLVLGYGYGYVRTLQPLEEMN